ncbi:ketoacyl-ACP synthase III [Alphaproteobacteria bacterium]|nr:ketoacyl-ACP synthase III [Alphaproteobacteria bacterium]
MVFSKLNIEKISYHFPAYFQSNQDLSNLHPDWDVEKVALKTGINKRYVAAKNETALDLGFEASKKLFKEFYLEKDCVESLILVTQSPDYFLPSSACILQNRLSLKTDTLCFDINLGCSGFVNGLAVASSIINSGIVQNCLLVCAETYSKYINDDDRTNKMVFSDAGSACFVEVGNNDNSQCGGFVFGTDGAGAEDLIVSGGCARSTQITPELHMNGSKVLMFTMREIPPMVEKCLQKCNMTHEDIDLFVFHQASDLVLNTLKSKLNIDDHRMFNNLSEVGNTVSSTIPIALKDAFSQGKIQPGNNILLCGFGVGLSWGCCVIKWGGK